ncbi:MAG TPA: hypothetical protein VIL30_18575 [Ramlibacter sp.]
MFRKSALASLALVFLSTVAHGGESLTSDREINGRSIESITATLAEYHGIDANLVEAYGDKILVHAKNENGTNSILFVDKDTLQPLSNASRVGTRLDVGRVQASPASTGWADEPTRSLVESDD